LRKEREWRGGRKGKEKKRMEKKGKFRLSPQQCWLELEALVLQWPWLALMVTTTQRGPRCDQVDRERCVIEGVVDGLTPGAHGLAIHETGDVSRGCASLGGHFNPRGTRHGSPEFTVDKRHVGDLGNVTAGEDGRASFRLTDKLVKVWDVIGRSVVVASKPDDLGLGSAPNSSMDGNCGTGVACGIIARSAGLGENTKKICACDGVTIWDERNRPAAGPGRRA